MENNNWFKQGREAQEQVQELENKKEKTVEDWTEIENKNTGKINKKNIKVEQFFQNKKVAYGLVGIIIAILGIGAYSGLTKNKKADEPITATERTAQATNTLELNEETLVQPLITDTNSQYYQEPTNMTSPETVDLSKYDTEIGSEYDADIIDFSNTGNSSPKFDDSGVEEKEKTWRKSEIGFKGKVSEVVQTSNTVTQQSLLEHQGQQQVQQIQQDQNNQAGKKEFLNQKRNSFISTNTINSPIGRYELKTGMFIPAVLETEINSDLPGTITALVSRNVHDFRTGRYVLIPMGAKLIGTYDSNVTYGQNRILLVWQRIIYPNGYTLELDNFQGVDLLGNSGIKGKVNNHFWKLMRSVLLSSIINIAAGTLDSVDLNIEAGRNATVTLGAGTSNAASNIQSIGERMVEKDLNRQPILQIKRGSKFQIMVQKDMILAPYKGRYK